MTSRSRGSILSLGLLLTVGLSAVPPAGQAAPAPVTPAALVASPPKNVIVMIGDGMGFNQLDAGTLFRYGTSYSQVHVDAGSGVRTRLPSVLPPQLAASDVRLAVRTTQFGGTYDPVRAWADFDTVRANPTDSAAAATAMATGVKTRNAAIGVDVTGATLQNVAEYAIADGRAAGVVTSVPFSHATPAGFSAHDTDRDHYKAIARDQLRSKLSVVMGAGHPRYTDNHTRRTTPKYTYLYKADYQRLTSGSSGFSFLTSKTAFEKLATGATPSRVFGIARVGSTLQQRRSGTTGTTGARRNAVPSLATMARGALNVLDADPDGFFLMVEGGAIDWANHDRQKGRLLEEAGSFLDAIAAVNAWVETHSSWAETLLIVTADHESGYLTGTGSDPDWTPLTGRAGNVPAMAYHSSGHTTQLVPFFARGAGADRFAPMVVGSDPVRGDYLDNTAVATAIRGLWP